MKRGSTIVWKPTKQQLIEAEGSFVPDLIAPNLNVLFCGINPGLYSGAVGHHFARPGNRFWPALHRGGFTSRQVSPFEERELLAFGLGITNIVDRATAGADELSADEMRAGVKKLVAKVKRYSPKVLAVLGVGAYRCGFERKNAKLGLQEEKIEKTNVWVLPNPSGLNAHHSLEDLAKRMRELRRFLESVEVLRGGTRGASPRG